MDRMAREHRDQQKKDAGKIKTKARNVFDSARNASKQKTSFGEKKVRTIYDIEIKDNDKSLKKGKKALDKVLKNENHRELSKIDIRGYANIRRRLPAEAAIERQEKVEKFQEALNSKQNRTMEEHKRKIDQEKSITRKKSKEDFHRIYQEGIEAEDSRYHYEFNKLRRQRENNRQFAMPFHNPEKLGMPDVSQLTRADYQQLAKDLGTTEEDPASRLSNWVEGVQRLQGTEREKKVEYGKAEVALYKQMDEHEYLDMQAKDLQEKKKDLQEKKEKLEGKDDEIGLEAQKNILEFEKQRLEDHKKRLEDDIKENEYDEIGLRAKLEEVEDTKKRITGTEKEIIGTEKEITGAKNDIARAESVIAKIETSEQKINDEYGYNNDKTALGSIKAHKEILLGMTGDSVREREEENRFLRENTDQGEISSKYKEMLRKKHAYEEAKGELKNKLTSTEDNNNLFAGITNKSGKGYSGLYSNVTWNESEVTIAPESEKRSVSDRINNKKLSEELEKGGVARSRGWFVRRMWSRFRDNRELSREGKKLKQEFREKLEAGDGKIEDAAEKYMHGKRIVDTDRMFRDQDYADSLAEGRKGIHDSIVKHDGKIAKLKLQKMDIRLNRNNYEHPEWEMAKLHAKHLMRLGQRKIYRVWKGYRDANIEKMDQEFHSKIETIEREHEHNPLSKEFKDSLNEKGLEKVFEEPAKAPERGPDSGINYGLREDFHLSWKQLGASTGSYDQQTTKALRHMFREKRRLWDISEANERRQHTQRARSKVELMELGRECQDLHNKIELETDDVKKGQYQEEFDKRIRRAAKCQEGIKACDQEIRGIKVEYTQLQNDDYAVMMERAQKL